MVIVSLPEEEVEGWRMRNEREGTVALLSGSASVTKRLSGNVSWPESKAEIVT